MSCENILFATPAVGQENSRVTEQVKQCAESLQANVQHLQVAVKASLRLLAHSYFSDTVHKWGRFAKITGQYAKTTTPDLLITPNIGKPGLLHNDYKGVLREARSDVLFIKGNNQPYQKILVAVDVENTNAAHLVLARAQQFSEEVGAELKLIYVFPQGTLEYLQYDNAFALEETTNSAMQMAWQSLMDLAVKHNIAMNKIIFRVRDIKLWLSAK